MIHYDPKLCNKCFIFPCVCGEQYKTLSTKQLEILRSNLTSLSNKATIQRSLKDCLSSEELGYLPDRFIKFLFEKNKDNMIGTVWSNLNKTNLLWKSCLAIFLSKYCNLNTTRNYYNLIYSILEKFNMPHHAILAQMIIAADNSGGDINIPLLLTCLNSDKADKDLINPYISIATYTSKTSGIDLIMSLAKIICIIGNVEVIPDVKTIISSNSFDIEDKVIFIDETMCELVCSTMFNNFDDITIN